MTTPSSRASPPCWGPSNARKHRSQTLSPSVRTWRCSMVALGSEVLLTTRLWHTSRHGPTCLAPCQPGTRLCALLSPDTSAPRRHFSGLRGAARFLKDQGFRPFQWDPLAAAQPLAFDADLAGATLCTIGSKDLSSGASGEAPKTLSSGASGALSEAAKTMTSKASKASVVLRPIKGGPSVDCVPGAGQEASVLKREAPKTLSSEASGFKAKIMSSAASGEAPKTMSSGASDFRRSSEDNVVRSFRPNSEDNVVRSFRRSSDVSSNFRRSSEDNVARSFRRSSEDTVVRSFRSLGEAPKTMSSGASGEAPKTMSSGASGEAPMSAATSGEAPKTMSPGASGEAPKTLSSGASEA